MKNENKFTIALLTTLISSSVFATEISSVNLYQDSGEGRIYANDRMQAEIYVSYDIEEGAQVEDIFLLNRNTREKITDIPGWSVDRQSNEYLHVIGMSSRSMALPSLNRTTERLNLYVRSDRVDNVDLCVEVTTVSGESQDNCDYGNAVQVQAIQPIRYSSDDFELKIINKIIDNSHRDLYQYSLLARNTNLLPIKAKKLLSVAAYGSSVYHLSALDALVRDYQRGDERSTSVTAFAMTPNDFSKVEYNGQDGGNYTKPLMTVNEQTIATIVHYARHKRIMLVGNRLECNDEKNRVGYWVCSLGQPDVTGAGWKLGDEAVSPHLTDILPGRLQIEDRYGNTGELVFNYPNDGDTLTMQ